MQINSDELIKQIAKDYGVSAQVVSDIVRSPFKMVREVIKEGKDSARLMYFGIFIKKEDVMRNNRILKQKRKENE